MFKRPSDIAVGIILVVVLFLSVWWAFSFFSPGSGERFVSDQGDVAIIPVTGMITDAEPFLSQLDRFIERRDVRAIVVRVESPGGVVAPSQEMYEGMRRAREQEKPIVVSMGSIAASGAYYLSLGADSIVANPGTMTGSIGVLMDFPETTQLLNSLGIEFHSVTSGPYKDAGSPYEEWTEETQEYFSSIVMNTYEQFLATVAEERRMDIEQVRPLADGRVFTGEQAVRNGLVDRLGDQYAAVHLAAEMAGISTEPTVVEAPQGTIRVWDLLFGDVEQILGRLNQVPLLKYQYP